MANVFFCYDGFCSCHVICSAERLSGIVCLPRKPRYLTRFPAYSNKLNGLPGAHILLVAGEPGDRWLALARGDLRRREREESPDTT